MGTRRKQREGYEGRTGFPEMGMPRHPSPVKADGRQSFPSPFIRVKLEHWKPLQDAKRLYQKTSE
jgi:hypothetical protein